MSTLSLEQRVARLESDLAQIKSQNQSAVIQPWWETIAGIFADDSDFDEAMALGQEYRRSLKPIEHQASEE